METFDLVSQVERGSSKSIECPFCEMAKTLSDSRVLGSNEFAYAIYDGYPVSSGHCLIISKRHVGSFFETGSDERQALLELIDETKAEIDIKHHPAAYNLGINDGPAAGQTIPHLHIHLIPRYEDISSDPRGGVRWVVPEKAVYWGKDL